MVSQVRIVTHLHIYIIIDRYIYILNHCYYAITRIFRCILNSDVTCVMRNTTEQGGGY